VDLCVQCLQNCYVTGNCTCFTSGTARKIVVSVNDSIKEGGLRKQLPFFVTVGDLSSSCVERPKCVRINVTVLFNITNGGFYVDWTF
jgi:hypothetical protein